MAIPLAINFLYGGIYMKEIKKLRKLCGQLSKLIIEIISLLGWIMILIDIFLD